MKRKLTYEKVCDIIDFEDSCGINNCLQELFMYGENNETILGKHVDVIGDFNDKEELGDYEVIKLKESVQ